MAVVLNLADWIERRKADVGPYADHIIHSVRAYEAEIASLRRRLGGGCDAANGGDHNVVAQGRYRFCSQCGETLQKSVTRYIHPAPTAVVDEIDPITN